MPRHLPLLFIALLLAAPPALFAADPAMQQVPQNVEEPDAPDEDSDMQMPPESPAPAEKSQAPSAPVPADVRPPGTEGQEGDASYDEVVLRALNKVTAHSQRIEAAIGNTVRFGTIEIVAHRCWRAAPDERPENAALLEISEIKQGEAPAQIFLGWMFSSTPGLSSLEHPFYDITVVECKKAQAEKQPETPPPAPKKSSVKAPR